MKCTGWRGKRVDAQEPMNTDDLQLHGYNTYGILRHIVNRYYASAVCGRTE